MDIPKSPQTTNDLKQEEFIPFPDLPEKETPNKFKKEYLILPIILLLFLGFLALGVFIYSKYYSPNLDIFNKTKQVSKIPEPPSERAQTYEFNHDPINTKPQPYKIVIDPIDPNSGEIQKLTIYINNSTPIISATAMVETDNNQIEQPLTLSNGNNRAGIWTTSWEVSDTYNNTYRINLTITDDAETYEGGISVI